MAEQMIQKPNSNWLLLAVLSTTAGATDVISFRALGGLFTAHITGNLVIQRITLRISLARSDLCFRADVCWSPRSRNVRIHVL